jgi:hypothetical protein
VLVALASLLTSAAKPRVPRERVPA